MPSMEVQECPVFEVERGQTHGQKFFQTNPPEGGGSIKLYDYNLVFYLY